MGKSTGGGIQSIRRCDLVFIVTSITHMILIGLFCNTDVHHIA